MKRFILLMILILSLFFGCTSAPQQLTNDLTDSHPGTIFITGTLHAVDFQSFYNQTEYNLDEYTIILNTKGGEAQACTGIIGRMTELQKQGIRFKTVVYTKAYSAGAFIFMMGDTRVMHQGSSLMWHTMIGQGVNDGKIFPKAYGEDRQEMVEGLDSNIVRLTKKAYPNVDPMTLETMLQYTGMTFIMAKDANTLGMVDEYIEN